MSASTRLRATVAVVSLLGVAAPAAASAATPRLPTISSFSPRAAAAMTKIVVHGKNFAHVKVVRVDGRKAKFVLDSATKLTVTIPSKAKSGRITVTTSVGTAKSARALDIKA